MELPERRGRKLAGSVGSVGTGRADEARFFPFRRPDRPKIGGSNVGEAQKTLQCSRGLAILSTLG